ncbi:MAG TPA: heme o synthase [Acetobacteraceae bacterium]|nr:heme o synthase [Acetobacteraceae bacterium]
MAHAAHSLEAEGQVSDVRDWLALLKPRVVSLVVFTGLIGLLLAPGPLHPVLAFASVLCIAVAAGSAGAINMWYDRDIDALMRRTAKRPIPAGRIAPDAALGFGVVLAVASVLVMFLATNLAAAFVLALSILFYVFVYTIWLKRRTPQNIVIGGAAGAFPPVIGWASVTGGIDVMPLLLFAIVFFWTPPHFWALSLYASGDYARAGVPMLPVVAGARATRRQILLYTVVLVAVSLLPWALGYAGPVYGIAAIALGATFLIAAARVLLDAQEPDGRSLTRDAPARFAFKYSLLYLFVLFLALAADHAVG